MSAEGATLPEGITFGARSLINDLNHSREAVAIQRRRFAPYLAPLFHLPLITNSVN